MIAIISLVVFDLAILIFGITTKKFLYTVTPEDEWQDAIENIDNTIKDIDELIAVSDYKLGNGHVYE